MIRSNLDLDLPLNNSLTGRSTFLACAGPSLSQVDCTGLCERGVLLAAVNNAATVVRPHLWIAADDPGNFSDAIWQDPAIWKFVPSEHFDRHFTVRDEQGRLVHSNETVRQMPAVFGYERNEQFVAQRWLEEPSFNWGNHATVTDALGHRGSRSVMLIAVKLLYYLGIRTVYLLGCDFKMVPGGPYYAFDQDRTAASIRGNNHSYRVLNDRFTALKPYFDRAGLKVYNCTPNSGLTAFPYLDLDTAIQRAIAKIPKKINTAGMYDRLARERDERRRQEKEQAGEATKKPLIQQNSARSLHNGNVPSRVRDVPPITTVLAVDEAHLDELRIVWPTWQRFRPEILHWPLLILFDAARPAGIWKQQLAFVGHPQTRIEPWEMPGVPQREKMLSAFIYGPARYVETPWYLKLDTDTVAMRPGDWCQPQWFQADADGCQPVFIGHRWGYTKPADAVDRLDDWGDSIAELRAFPRLSLPRDDRSDRVHCARVISWCFFGQTDWTRQMAALCPDHLPVPSQDNYLWYCAARRGDLFRRIQMKEYGWDHLSRRRRLMAAAQEALRQPTGADRQMAAAMPST